MSPSPSRTSHLVIMAKAPRLGRVKTRLAAGIGVVAAWSFYRRTLAALARRLAADPRWRTRLAVTPDGAAGDARMWLPGVPLFGQGPGDLGRRMQRVFDTLPPGPVVIVGADIPAIRPRHIGTAFARLGSHDAVFGPATDSGYWLVGLRRRPAVPEPFVGVRWSSPHALADTLANLAGRRVAFVDSLDDIDDRAAYDRWTAGR